MNKNFRKYIIFWLSQALSQMGSQMTGFALILWAYEQSHAAMTVSLMSFFNYVPYILVSIVAGAFVDNHRKKPVMLASDAFAAVCSVAVLLLSSFHILQMYHIYIVNFVIGLMNAFQGPASSVAVGKMVPKEKLAQVSGMNSFSGNLIMVLAPVCAAALYVAGGLPVILCIDLCSFAIAFIVLVCIRIPQDEPAKTDKKAIFAGCAEGFDYLKHNQAILIVILTMALLNFLSRLTYENILNPMILARSGNDSVAFGVVNAIMGIGGIVGGLIVATGKFGKNSVDMIYFSAMLSFLLGDLMMGLGQNVIIWSCAGLMASLPIPFINAGQNLMFYDTVPTDIQGRIFAVRNAIQFCTIPLGILLGGALADYVLEPFMMTDNRVTAFLHLLVGEGAGAGMAVMFLGTGILGSLFSFIFYKRVKTMLKPGNGEIPIRQDE